MSCICCGKSNVDCGLLCVDCTSEYRKDLATGRIPTQFKGWEVLFGKREWAEARRMRAAMTLDDKTDTEIEAKLDEYVQAKRTEYERAQALLKKRQSQNQALLDMMRSQSGRG